MKIVFTGDLFTGGELINEDYNKSLIEIDSFIKADLRVSNLEQATSDSDYELDKSTVYSPSKGINFLSSNNIDIVGLANNHIHDKGLEGLLNTQQLLKKNNIKFFGAGLNLKEAEKPIIINEEISLIGYCDNGKSYLNKVQIAESNRYGINPFSYEKVINEIEKINDNRKVIIFLHWGKENVWFPPKDNIELAKKLLKHNKVHSIIGSHSHRIQGKIKYNGKYAFFSLGNFLFPNFYMEPRSKIVYPISELSNIKTTKEYHPVFSLTKKIWKYSNRVSMILSLENGEFKETFIKQDRNKPLLKELIGIEKHLIKLNYCLLSLIFKLPIPLYVLIQKISYIFDKLNKTKNLLYFYIIKEKNIIKFFSLIKLKNIKKF